VNLSLDNDGTSQFTSCSLGLLGGLGHAIRRNRQSVLAKDLARLVFVDLHN
jgi:hypothetical protein